MWDMETTRALLVEDDADVRRLCRTILIPAVCDAAEEAASFAEAKQALEVRTYDLVVTDIYLGDGLGTDLVDQALQSGAAVVVITGHVDDVLFARLQTALSVCVAKPIRPLSLRVLTRALLARRGSPVKRE